MRSSEIEKKFFEIQAELRDLKFDYARIKDDLKNESIDKNKTNNRIEKLERKSEDAFISIFKLEHKATLGAKTYTQEEVDSIKSLAYLDASRVANSCKDCAQINSYFANKNKEVKL